MKRKKLLVCTLCLSILGFGIPVRISSAEENTESSSQISYSPVDLGIVWQDSFTFGYLGLDLQLSDTLKPLIDSQNVIVTPRELSADSGTSIGYAALVLDYVTDEQKAAELTDFDESLYTWLDDLQRIGAIGVYQKDLTEYLDEITKCSKHTELGKSEDGSYVYYLSINSSAEAELTESLEKSDISITDMAPYQAGASAFDTPRVSVSSVGAFQTTDINGTAYDESLFQEYDLTLVNIFATWCSPCVNELPELEEIYQKLGEEYNIGVAGFVMDTVDANFLPASDQDDVLAKAKLLSEKTGATFPFLIPDETALNGRLIGIDAVPETFFVGRDGNIVGETYTGARSYEDWEAIIKTELANLKCGSGS